MKRGLSDREISFPAPTRPRLTGDAASHHHRPPLQQRLIADHYSQRLNRSVLEREKSPIIHLKKLNNWIKSILVQRHTTKGDSVIDIACGKGGDLMKWEKAGIGFYVGLDIAEGSIADARTRYNSSFSTRCSAFSFPAMLFCGDCFSSPLDHLLRDVDHFDICSCHFALHYSWATETRARRALQNVSAVLKHGGYFIGTIPDADALLRKLRESSNLEFGNSCYKVTFDDRHSSKKFSTGQPFGIQYRFHLDDAVDDCPEWLVPFEPFRLIAADYGLELVFMTNFHQFIHEESHNPSSRELMGRIGFSMHDVSPDEWDTASLYRVFVFRKIGPSRLRGPKRPRKAAAHPIKIEDVAYI